MGSREHQRDLLEVVLELRSEQPGGPVHPVDAGELVHDDHGRGVACPGDEGVEEGVEGRLRVGAFIATAGELDTEKAEAEVEAGGDGVEGASYWSPSLRQRRVETAGQVGDRGDFVQVRPDDAGAGVREVGGHAPQHGRLAVAPGAEERSDSPGGEPLGQVGDQALPTLHLVRFEGPLVRERRDLHPR